MRDAITLFEQYAIGGELTYEMIAKNLQLVGDVFLENFSHALIAKDSMQVLKDLEYLKEQGVDIKIFLEQMTFFLRDKLIVSVGSHIFGKYLEIFERFHEIYSKLRFAPNAFMLFEISVLGLIHETRGEPVIIEKKVEVVKEKIISTPKEEKKIPEKPIISSEAEEVFEQTTEATVSKKSELDWKKFDFNTLVANIKFTPGKSFVSMSLKSSSYAIE